MLASHPSEAMRAGSGDDRKRMCGDSRWRLPMAAMTFAGSSGVDPDQLDRDWAKQPCPQKQQSPQRPERGFGDWGRYLKEGAKNDVPSCSIDAANCGD